MTKKVLTIALCLAVILGMGGVAGLVLPLEASAESIAVDFTKYSTKSSDNSSFSISRDTFEVNPNGGRVSFVSTSDKTFDFTRSFTLSGKMSNSVAPDGMTVTFQPDGDYSYDGTYGSSLCAYKFENTTGARNALVAEFDTYYNGSIDDNDVVNAIGSSRASRIPHIAIATIDGSGKDTPIDAAKAEAGQDQSFRIQWDLTDPDAGSGTYTFTYSGKSVSYSGLVPADLFGSDEAYLSLTGSVNFDPSYGDSKTPWGLTLDTIKYTDPEPAVSAVSFTVAENGQPSEGTYDVEVDGQLMEGVSGEVTLDPVTYAEAGRYTYTIREIAGKKGSVQYDTKEYLAEVTVTRKGNKLVADTRYYDGDKSMSSLTIDNKVDAEPKLSVSEQVTGAEGAKGGDLVTFAVTVSNDAGGGTAHGIRVRRYVPEYLNFYEIESVSGVTCDYGCNDQKEFANWYIEKLEPGKSVTLTFTAEAHYCKPDSLDVGSGGFYEHLDLADPADAPYANTKTDPAEAY